MALLTAEQAADTRQRIVAVAKSMMDTDAGRAELVKLAKEINALADEARTRAQFAAVELNGKQSDQKLIGEQDSNSNMVILP